MTDNILNENKKQNESEFSSDFKSMIWILPWISLGFFFLSIILPIFAWRISNDGIFVGLLTSSQVIGGLVSSFIAGFIADRVKRKKKMIVSGSFGRSLSYILIYFALCNNSYFGLILGTFLLGFMAGFFRIPFDVLISEKSHKNNRSQAFGKRNFTDGIGQGIGAGIGFLIFSLAGNFTDNPFIQYSAILVFALSNLCGGVLFILKVDETLKISSHVEPKQISLQKEEDNKNNAKSMRIGILFLFVVVLMTSINASLARPFVLIYITEKIESDLFLVSLTYLPAGLLAIIFSSKLGQIADKMRPMLGIAIISISGAFMTWILIHIPNLLWFSLIVLIDFTLGTAGILIFQNFMSRINLKHRGKILGINSAFSSLGAVIGPILGGIAFNFDLTRQLPFIISIFVELCLIPLYWIIAYYLLPIIEEKYEPNKIDD